MEWAGRLRFEIRVARLVWQSAGSGASVRRLPKGVGAGLDRGTLPMWNGQLFLCRREFRLVRRHYGNGLSSREIRAAIHSTNHPWALVMLFKLSMCHIRYRPEILQSHLGGSGESIRA